MNCLGCDFLGFFCVFVNFVQSPVLHVVIAKIVKVRIFCFWAKNLSFVKFLFVPKEMHKQVKYTVENKMYNASYVEMQKKV